MMTRRIVSLYLVGYLILVFAIAWGFHQIAYQADYRAWESCRNSNAARSAIKDALRESTEALITAATMGPSARLLSPAERERQERGIRFYREQAESGLAKIKRARCPSKPS
jgi:hypothetical protein